MNIRPQSIGRPPSLSRTLKGVPERGALQVEFIARTPPIGVRAILSSIRIALAILLPITA